VRALQQKLPLQPFFNVAILQLVFDAHVAHHIVLVAQILDLVLQIANPAGVELTIVEIDGAVEAAILVELRPKPKPPVALA
jgi:hypothetical protein